MLCYNDLQNALDLQQVSSTISYPLSPVFQDGILSGLGNHSDITTFAIRDSTFLVPSAVSYSTCRLFDDVPTSCIGNVSIINTSITINTCTPLLLFFRCHIGAFTHCVLAFVLESGQHLNVTGNVVVAPNSVVLLSGGLNVQGSLAFTFPYHSSSLFFPPSASLRQLHQVSSMSSLHFQFLSCPRQSHYWCGDSGGSQQQHRDGCGRKLRQL